jgi:WD40 repeat protein
MVIAQAIRTRVEAVRPEDFKDLVVLPDDTEIVVFSSNGASAAAEAKGQVSTWSLPSGYTVPPISPSGRFRSMAVSPNGAYVTVATDESVSIWPLNGKPMPNWTSDLRKSDSSPFSSPSATLPEPVMAVSSDGNVVVLTFADASARLIVGREVLTGRTSDPFAAPTGARLLRGHKNGIVDVTLSGDGAVIATAGADGTVRLWENPVGRMPRERPSASTSWSDLWNRLRSQTTACLTATDRVRLLNESESLARAATHTCETLNVLKAFAPPPRSAPAN